eukprot:7209678-Pyramimonas_sp.AAC.1
MSERKVPSAGAPRARLVRLVEQAARRCLDRAQMLSTWHAPIVVRSERNVLTAGAPRARRFRHLELVARICLQWRASLCQWTPRWWEGSERKALCTGAPRTQCSRLTQIVRMSSRLPSRPELPDGRDVVGSGRRLHGKWPRARGRGHHRPR